MNRTNFQLFIVIPILAFTISIILVDKFTPIHESTFVVKKCPHCHKGFVMNLDKEMKR